MKKEEPWRNTLLVPTATVREAVESINDNAQQICLIVDERLHLLGTVTDGDIRRGLLDGLDLDAPVDEVMNRKPLVASPETGPDELLKRMNAAVLRQIPLLDGGNRVVGLAHIRDLMEPIETRDNWVVLMAGGLGERLRPLTEQTPKPLLTVGEKPLLQTILENFIEQNFNRFYISLNYKADAIKDYFGDGGKWGVEIRYLEENERLGTAGALKLMPAPPESPFIVMNGDLITRINFQDLLDYHDQQKSKGTMCVREYDFQVPFGVVGIDGNRIKTIDEKPIHRFFVNAGIYVLDPDLISLIPDAASYDMTELFQRMIDEGHNNAVFPIHEFWLDVGRIEDLNRANLDASENRAR